MNRKWIRQFAVWSLMSGLAFAGEEKLAKDLKDLDPQAEADVIVQFTPGSASQKAKDVERAS